MANKGPRIKISLVSTAKTVDGKPTKTTYYTFRNTRDTEKLDGIKKFDPRGVREDGKVGGHFPFKEKKIAK